MFLIFSVPSAQAKKSNSSPVHGLGEWQITLSRGDQGPIPLQQGTHQILRVENKNDQVLYVASDHHPVSIQDVRKKMKKQKLNPKHLRVVRRKGGAWFSFRNGDNQAFWYSTKGGSLIVTKKEMDKKSYQRLLKSIKHSKLSPRGL